MNVKQFLCAGMTGALLVAGLTACAPGAPEVTRPTWPIRPPV